MSHPFQVRTDEKICLDYQKHQEDILNYFKVRIDSGAVEDLNNKAKAISHRAYGYRAAETFKLALYHGMGNLTMPQLTHKFL